MPSMNCRLVVPLNANEASIAEAYGCGLRAARKLLACGAKSTAISLGDRGLVGIQGHDEPAIHAWNAPLRAKSTVGCGDSALAGFAFATATGLSFERSLALAVACGAANCLATLPARITQEDVSRIEQSVRVERI